MKNKTNAWLGLLLLFLASGCDSLSDYSTDAGSCYVGSIIDADFVRSGAFDADVRLRMALNVNALAGGSEEGAVITTSDGLFKGAPVRQMLELTRDSLSQLHFPGGRTRNYLAYAPDRNGQLANVVISLMENGDVEVRIFRPSLKTSDTLFGVFRLVLKEGCQPPVYSKSDSADTDSWNSTDSGSDAGVES